LYISTNQGVLYALKTSDGSQLWQSTYEGANLSPTHSGLTVAP
jgi:outer membrane protein assembly factor BamB